MQAVKPQKKADAATLARVSAAVVRIQSMYRARKARKEVEARKKAMEEEFEDSWHVIVGTNFGSFVSYEHKCIILFWLEHIGFLLFKHG